MYIGQCLTTSLYGRAIRKTKIRQARRSATYQFGYLIAGDYKHALELDKLNGNSRWYDATKKELDQINEYQVFNYQGRAKYNPKSKGSQMHLKDTRQSRYTWYLQISSRWSTNPRSNTHHLLRSSFYKIPKAIYIPSQTKQHEGLGSRYWQCVPRS